MGSNFKLESKINLMAKWELCLHCVKLAKRKDGVNIGMADRRRFFCSQNCALAYCDIEACQKLSEIMEMVRG